MTKAGKMIDPGRRGKTLDAWWAALVQAGTLYQRPTFSGDDRVFYDLVAYAPGMNTSREDILAVLDAEALPRGRVKLGTVAPAARRLVDHARQLGWQKLTIPGDSGQPDLHILFNGRGDFVYERTIGLGLHEKVVCDGRTLVHLYPDLGIGARRTVSRFHRASFTGMLRRLVPPAGDLIHGTEVTCSGDHTVVITPLGAATAKDGKSKPVAYRCLHLVFTADGRLAERQIVAMPEHKILAREVYEANGTIRVLDGKGKQVVEQKWRLIPTTAPDLHPDTRGLVVLPLPWRTREHAVETFKIPANPNFEDMPEQEALALFAADFASNNAEATQVFGRRFYSRDIKWLGFYTFLAAAGINVDAEQQYLNLMAEHPADTLAKYLAFHSNPELRRHAHWGELNSPRQGMLRRMATFRVLWMHWQAEAAKGGNEADRQRALQFVRDNHSRLGWTLLGLLQQKAGKHAKFLENIARAYHAFAGSADLGYLSRYEEARSLLQGQRRSQARQLFTKLYADTLKRGILPPLDADFRLALQSDGHLDEAWTPLVRQTAAGLAKDGHRLLAIALAWQCWQLGDQALADNALAAALDHLPKDKGRLIPTLAAIEFLLQTNQPVRADNLLRPLLADKHFGERPELWRLGMRIAEARKQTPRSLACLERALALEAEHLPPVINLRQVRTDYGALLEH
ncbi:MAG TPA: hypothetical protein VFA18_04610, partial [Gemmataceae bacterium]|nr:hypothetical protein [Gemmataceae bacterium]